VYTIQPAAPTFSPSPLTSTSTQSVSLADTTSGAAIYYTIDGTTPTSGSTPYTGPIPVSITTTIKAIAVAAGMTTPSAIASGTYTIVTVAPTFSPAAGSFSSTQSVSVLDTTSGAAIYYTIDGTTPTAASTPYTVPIPVSATTTIKAMAVATGRSPSAVATGTYTILSQPSAPGTPALPQ
jgi:hypothetical protein